MGAFRSYEKVPRFLCTIFEGGYDLLASGFDEFEAFSPLPSLDILSPNAKVFHQP